MYIFFVFRKRRLKFLANRRSGKKRNQKIKKNPKLKCLGLTSAESEGFEPPDLLQSTVFKTAAIDHSANSPETIISFSVVQI